MTMDSASISEDWKPIPSIMMESLFHHGTRFEFFEQVLDENGSISYPYGGTMCSCLREDSNSWNVLWYSPFPGRGFIPIKHPEYGFTMPKRAAIQLAKQWQP